MPTRTDIGKYGGYSLRGRFHFAGVNLGASHETASHESLNKKKLVDIILVPTSFQITLGRGWVRAASGPFLKE